MRITLHIKPTRGLRSVIQEQRSLSRLFPSDDNPWIELKDTDPLCDRLFEFCASYEPKPIAGSIIVKRCLTVSTEFDLAMVEWNQINLFQVFASKARRVPALDDKLNFEWFLSESPVDKGGWRPVRTATTLTYSKDVNPAEIIQLPSEWADEYIAGHAVKAAIDSSHLTGIRFNSVRGKRGKGTNSSCFQLICDQFSPPSVREATAWDRQLQRERYGSRWTEPDTRYVLKGLVCLPRTVLQRPPTDVCRSSDPLAPNGCPGWLVRRCAVETVARHNLVGWSFGPVLMEGTDLYEEYMRRMKRIEAWVSSHPFNDFMTTKSGSLQARKIIEPMSAEA